VLPPAIDNRRAIVANLRRDALPARPERTVLRCAGALPHRPPWTASVLAAALFLPLLFLIAVADRPAAVEAASAFRTGPVPVGADRGLPDLRVWQGDDYALRHRSIQLESTGGDAALAFPPLPPPEPAVPDLGVPCGPSAAAVLAWLRPAATGPPPAST
jgi:hypothetical protein